MTADTPSREVLAKRLEQFGPEALLTRDEIRTIITVLRLAGKPADDGVREATIEECAKVVDAFIERCDNRGDAQTQGQIGAALGLARDIRALSTKAKR